MDRGEKKLWLILGGILVLSLYSARSPLFNSRIAAPPAIKNIFHEMPILETERLILRKVRPEDAKDLFEIYSDPEVAKYVPWEPVGNINDIGRWVAEHFEQYKKGSPSCWIIEHKEEKRAVGWCGFLRWQPKSGRVNIYTALSRKHWCHGYMTEAKRAVISYAFNVMGCNSILSYVHPANKAAIRVNEKLGFRTAGTIPEYIYCKGAYQDRMCMCLLRSDFITGGEAEVKGNDGSYMLKA
jgi:ribosomal-protein-alanine N-acetyltransferase